MIIQWDMTGCLKTQQILLYMSPCQKGILEVHV